MYRYVEVIQRYAALRTDVAFVCRKQGEARPALHCPVVANRVDRLQAIYGASVARELTPLSLQMGGGGSGGGGGGGGGSDRFGGGGALDESVSFTLDALVSTAGGLYKLKSISPGLESAWFQPLEPQEM